MDQLWDIFRFCIIAYPRYVTLKGTLDRGNPTPLNPTPPLTETLKGFRREVLPSVPREKDLIAVGIRLKWLGTNSAILNKLQVSNFNE